MPCCCWWQFAFCWKQSTSGVISQLAGEVCVTFTFVTERERPVRDSMKFCCSREDHKAGTNIWEMLRLQWSRKGMKAELPSPLTPAVVQISGYLMHTALYLRSGNGHACPRSMFWVSKQPSQPHASGKNVSKPLWRWAILIDIPVAFYFPFLVLRREVIPRCYYSTVPAIREGRAPGGSGSSVRVYGRAVRYITWSETHCSQQDGFHWFQEQTLLVSSEHRNNCCACEGWSLRRAFRHGVTAASITCSWLETLEPSLAPAARGICSSYTAHPIISHDRERKLAQWWEIITNYKLREFGTNEPPKCCLVEHCVCVLCDK